MQESTIVIEESTRNYEFKVLLTEGTIGAFFLETRLGTWENLGSFKTRAEAKAACFAREQEILLPVDLKMSEILEIGKAIEAFCFKNDSITPEVSETLNQVQQKLARAMF